MGLNRALLGKEYPPQEYKIEAEETKKYAFGYNEDLPRFTDDSCPGGLISPPMFGVKYTGPCVAQAFFDPELNCDFARLVHGEQDMRFLEPVKPGDTITSVGRIATIEEKASGEVFSVEMNSTNQDGKPVLKVISTFFIRGKAKDLKDKAPKKEEEAPQIDYLFTQDMKVKEDQTYIYAEGSGDHNPIHVDPDFAKMVGLPGIILQGLCSMAFCYKAVQDGYCDRDPLRIKRLSVRFAKPVLPLDTVTTRVWVQQETGDTVLLGLDAINQAGDICLKNGLAEIARP